MERTILVGIKLQKTKRIEIDYSMAELERLAETAGAVGEIKIIQNRNKIDPAYVIGKGKALEIAEIAKAQGIHTVIFDDDLKPVQQRNLEEIMAVKVIDRTRLILDIFAKRARSKEGLLQVELAQLKYLLPRITEKFGTFEQQVGGIGTRGPGERKLEVDQRRVRNRISWLGKEIESVRQHRDVIRQKRIESGIPTIAIVGYTNAGKSSLLNALSHSDSVYADDKLFATLDPTTRHIMLPAGRTVLFTDTVGFIRKLPHDLIAAFRATLEEISMANCILHVIDVSQPDYEDHIQTTLRVLKEIHAEDIPMIPVYNKSDLLAKDFGNKLARQYYLLISAKKGTGIKDLLKKVETIVIPQLDVHTITVPYNKIQYITHIFNLSVIVKQEYTDTGIHVKLKSTREHWEKIKAMVIG